MVKVPLLVVTGTIWSMVFTTSMAVGVLLKLTVVVVLPVTLKQISKSWVPLATVWPLSSTSVQLTVMTPGVPVPKEDEVRPGRLSAPTEEYVNILEV